MENCKELTKCVCCESEQLRTILDLGNQTPANNYNIEEKFPLRLNVCMECSHAQISHVVDPGILFRDYPYRSGVSKTMRDYYKNFAQSLINSFPKVKTVYEIACNDGAQLEELRKIGLECSGIDPVAFDAIEGVIPNVTCGYFPKDAPTDKRFDVIVAQNVFAHVENPFEFLQGCKKIMHKDSILLIQTSQSKMLENHQFDTIYHEHISFFNERSITGLFTRSGFKVIGMNFIGDVHGGSTLYTLEKLPEISMLDYSDFANRCYKFADEFRTKVEELQKDNTILCYGAAAKMINLIRFTGINPTAIIDDTPSKIDKVIDGINIYNNFYLEAHPDAVIIPVWNFFDEIKAKVKDTQQFDYKFLKYTPKIELV